MKLLDIKKGGEKMKEEKEENEKKELKVEIVKESRFQKIKNVINYIISIVILILIIYVAITIKNGLDDTMSIKIKNAQKICGYDACIIIQGVYEKGFVDWNIREYWPFFAISIGATGFEEGQDVDIICPVELKTDTFQHILTKLYFLYQKDNIKSCSLSPA